MGKLYITELRDIGFAGNGVRTQAAQLPAIAEQVVTFTASTASAEFNSDTRFIRISSDADCHFVVGVNPIATTNNAPLSGGKLPEYFGVIPGHKIAVIAH